FPSLSPDASHLPSAENATALASAACPLSDDTSRPSATLQMPTLRSAPAVAIRFPSGENAMALTAPVVRGGVPVRRPAAASHRVTTDTFWPLREAIDLP